MLAVVAIIATALAFMVLPLLAEMVFDFVYCVSPGFRRMYRDFYRRCRGR